MARGKGGLSSNVVLVTTRRRATSVPAEPETLTSYTPESYRRARHVASAAFDDSASLSAASKRHDRQLMDNINDRLYNAPFTQPVTVRRSRRASVSGGSVYGGSVYGGSAYGGSRPPVAPRRAVPTGGCAKRIASVQAAQQQRKRAAYDDDDDDDLSTYSFPQFKLPPPRALSRQVRSQSVPPRTNVDLGFIDNKSPLMRVADDSRSRSASHYMSPSTRFVRTVEVPLGCMAGGGGGTVTGGMRRAVYTPAPVYTSAAAYTPAPVFKPVPVYHPAPVFYTAPVALHTEEYYRPYLPERPRFLATNVKSYRSASEPPKRRNSMVADQAVRRAREALGRVEREIGSTYDTDYDIDEPLVTATPIMPVRSSARTGFVRGTVPTAPRRSGRPPLPTSSNATYSSVPRSQRLAQIEARLNSQMGYEEQSCPVSYSQLRTKTHEARDKMDTHKVLLDRYLPINWGPENEVESEVLYKYGELEERGRPSTQLCLIPAKGAEKYSVVPRTTRTISNNCYPQWRQYYRRLYM